MCISLGGLASRVKRKDTLALKLERQQEKEQSQDQDDTTWTNKEQWEALRNKIGSTLTRSACVFRGFHGVFVLSTLTLCVFCSHRRLSQRPTAQELEQRNILLGQLHPLCSSPSVAFVVVAIFCKDFLNICMFFCFSQE